MKKVLLKDKKASPAPGKAAPEREDNRAWALKWDGAALAAMRGKKRDRNRWVRP
ncbi:MAG: hypothetical protein U9N00_00045 [Candidatus Bipolaricaulota bacterium]|nr:hypothetical protein [Candidatus Bipolaricaulota bacterium]